MCYKKTTYYILNTVLDINRGIQNYFVDFFLKDKGFQTLYTNNTHNLKYCLIEFIHITTRKHEINDGGIPREFVIKEALRGISEEIRFVVTRSP